MQELTSHGGRLGAERETIIRKVLQRVIPDTYEIGSGQIIDANNSRSKQIDIVIARKDFPQIRFNDRTANYLAESVVATLEIKSELTKKELKIALDNAKSVSYLQYHFDQESSERICKEFSVTTDAQGIVSGPQANVQRVLAATRPSTYIVGLRGWETSDNFYSHMETWIKSHTNGVGLRDLPSLVVYGKGDKPGLAEGCFAWRNDDLETYTVKSEHGDGPQEKKTPGLLLGEEKNTLRLLILHLLRTIQRAAPRLPQRQRAIAVNV